MLYWDRILNKKGRLLPSVKLIYYNCNPPQMSTFRAASATVGCRANVNTKQLYNMGLKQANKLTVCTREQDKKGKPLNPNVKQILSIYWRTRRWQ